MRSLAAVAAVATVLSLGTAATPARAIPAQDIYDSCQQFEEICYGYMAGAFDALKPVLLGRPEGFCVQRDTRLNDLRETFMAFVRGNPGSLGIDAAVVLANALRTEFPCAPGTAPTVPAPPPQ